MVQCPDFRSKKAVKQDTIFAISHRDREAAQQSVEVFICDLQHDPINDRSDGAPPHLGATSALEECDNAS